jgi:hypothetical protein
MITVDNISTQHCEQLRDQVKQAIVDLQKILTWSKDVMQDSNLVDDISGSIRKTIYNLDKDLTR